MVLVDSLLDDGTVERGEAGAGLANLTWMTRQGRLVPGHWVVLARSRMSVVDRAVSLYCKARLERVEAGRADVK